MTDVKVLEQSLHSAETDAERLRALLSLAHALQHSDPRKSLCLAEKAIPLAGRLADQQVLMSAFYLAGDRRAATGDNRTALRYHLQGLQLSEFNRDERHHLNALTGVAWTYVRLGEYDQALNYLEQALSIAKAQGDEEGKLRAKELVGHVDMRLGRFERAYETFESLLKQLRSSGDWERLSGYSNNLAIVLAERAADESPDIRTQSLKRAQDYFELSARYAELSEIPIRQLGAKVDLAKFYAIVGKLKEAKSLNEEVLERAQALGARRQETLCLINRGFVCLQQGQPEQALPELEQAFEVATATAAKGDLIDIHKNFTVAYERLNNTPKALEHHRHLYDVTMQLKHEAAERRAEVISTMFELEKVRREAELHRLRTVELECLVRERTQALEASQLETLERLALVAEFRSEDIEGHTGRVGDLSARLGEHLGLAADETVKLRLAARLHDIGKIAIPDEILLKPGKFTPEEWALMQTHTTIGAQMLSNSSSSLLNLAEEITQNHHEHWNGRGYPRALKGEAIPLSGRIVAVADVFDALIDERPYKPAWPQKRAVREICSQAGKQFDPQVVEAFLQVINTFDTHTRL